MTSVGGGSGCGEQGRSQTCFFPPLRPPARLFFWLLRASAPVRARPRSWAFVGSRTKLPAIVGDCSYCMRWALILRALSGRARLESGELNLHRIVIEAPTIHRLGLSASRSLAET